MPPLNNRSSLMTDPIRNFRFLVQFKPHDTGLEFTPTLGFTSVSGLAAQTESIPYREGGYNTTIHQLPGQTTFSPITMQRGLMLGTPQHWEWMKRLFSVTDLPSANYRPGFRCDISIWVLNHPSPTTAGAGTGGTNEIGSGTGSNKSAIDIETGNAVALFRVFNAWPTSVAYSDLNAGDNALLVEQCTFVHEGYDVQLRHDYSSPAPTD